MLSPYPDARVAESYEALLADPEVDAVYNPLPNSLHREWTTRALEAGKHVLCEKPLAMDAREAEEMAAVAGASRRHLMEAFMYRFHPDMREFIARVREPLYVETTFGFALTDSADIRYEKALGGGALLDLGCYAVNVARWLFGEPVEVEGYATMKGDVDVTSSAQLTFSGGASASMWVSFESPEDQHLRVVTRTGVLERRRPFSAYRDPHDPYQLMVESFADSVLLDRPVEIPLSDSIANMRILDRIRDSFSS